MTVFNYFDNLQDDEKVKIKEVGKRWSMEPEAVLTLCKNCGVVGVVLADVFCQEFEIKQLPAGEALYRLKDSGNLHHVFVKLPKKDIENIIATGKIAPEFFENGCDLFTPIAGKVFAVTLEDLYIEKSKVLDVERELGIHTDKGNPEPQRKRKKSTKQAEIFNVPEGIEWQEIRIHFTDYKNVKVSIGAKTVERNFKALGFARNASDEPKKGWLFLLSMAATRGNPPVADNNKKKISDLGKALMQLFPDVPGKPFRRYAKGVGWQPRINLTLQENFADTLRQ